MQMGKYILRLLILFVLQIFVFNNMYLFNILHPYIYLLFLIFLPMGLPANLALIIGFLTGFLIDIFQNTFGMHISACVFLMFVKQIYFNLSFKEDDEMYSGEPALAVMGVRNYMSLILFLVFSHHLLLYLLEVFSFANFHITFAKVVLNTIFSSFFIFTYMILFTSKRKMF
jgi:rod shape-determining protein MreD